MMQPQPHPDELLTSDEVCKMLKISKRTFVRMRADGHIPPPIVSARRTTLRWRRADILEATATTVPLNGSHAALVQSCSSHIRAAAMSSRSATMHADAAAAALRRITQKKEEANGQRQAEEATPNEHGPPQARSQSA